MTPAATTRDDIDPFVLTGGRSSRFGRDKLLVSTRDGLLLIDHPIAALRSVFGPRVAIVGQCDSSLSARADRVIDDPYPGVGPIGGIVAALESTSRDVFVLAGDLPGIESGHVRQIFDIAKVSPNAHAVLEEAPALVRAHFGTSEARICFGYDELREKVVCADHGLDDRNQHLLTTSRSVPLPPHSGSRGHAPLQLAEHDRPRLL